ncbi:MAG: acyltransferase family protein [Bacteroidales bacterium]|nr:acyltransferase family protein [Bacteroidales bacterium]
MRNLSVDFFRYFFSIEICLWHYLGKTECFNHGYLAVEFYFILSGYFIARSATQNTPPSVLDYTLKKVKKFYPKLLIASIPLVFIAIAKMIIVKSPETISVQINNILNECLFLGSSGVFKGRLNGTLWYINVLVIGGGILYGILRTHYKEALGFILPMGIIMVYTYLLTLYNGSLRGEGLEYPFLNKGLLRGFVAMSLGILLHEFIVRKKEFLYDYVNALDVAGIGSLSGIVIISMIRPNFDAYILPFSCMLILCCMIDGTFLNRTFANTKVKWMGQMSLNLYFIHFPVCILCHALGNVISTPLYLNIFLYLLVVHLTAVCYGKICKYIGI